MLILVTSVTRLGDFLLFRRSFYALLLLFLEHVAKNWSRFWAIFEMNHFCNLNMGKIICLNYLVTLFVTDWCKDIC